MRQGVLNRLTKELGDLVTNPPQNTMVQLENEQDIKIWNITIIGPEDTPYYGGCFKLTCKFPEQYPFKPPIINFNTQIYHPQVKSDDGAICDEIFQADWAPTLQTRWCIDKIMQMLKNPSSENPLEYEVARQMQQDYQGYVNIARDWTAKFAV